MNPFGPDDEEEDEKEFVCQSCGEDWDAEATAFYLEGRCKNCGAAGSANKVIKDRENPLLRGEDDGN